MKNPLILFLFFNIHWVTLLSQTDIPSGDVFGTWDIDGSPYTILGDVTIPEGLSLTIDPGVEVLFTLNAGIKAEGDLIAIGEEDNYIFFKQETPGILWEGLSFERDFDNLNSSLMHCEISGAVRGIYIQSKRIRIEGCHIYTNSTDGIRWRAVVGDFEGLIVSNHIADNGGWGIYNEVDIFGRDVTLSPVISGNLIEENREGGILVQAHGNSFSGTFSSCNNYGYAIPHIVNNRIQDNMGYGIKCFSRGLRLAGTPCDHRAYAYTNPTIENNIINGNEGAFSAEAPYPSNLQEQLSISRPIISTSTMIDNGSTDIFVGDSAQVQITNSMIWTSGSAGFDFEGGGVLDASYCNLGTVYAGDGNISVAPDFFDSANGDFRLMAYSAGIDQGNNDYVNEDWDYEGRDRIVDGNGDGISTVDMGAYEYNPPRILEAAPDMIEACEGDEVTLEIVAEGSNLNYQWQKDGQDISGENSSSLFFQAATLNDQGRYACIISDELGGEITSDESELIVIPEAECSTGINPSDNSISFDLFPNPSFGEITITLPVEMGVYNLNIINMQGQVIYSKSNNSPQLKIKDIPKGFYLVQVTNNQFVSVKKLTVE